MAGWYAQFGGGTLIRFGKIFWVDRYWAPKNIPPGFNLEKRKGGKLEKKREIMKNNGFDAMQIQILLSDYPRSTRSSNFTQNKENKKHIY